VGGGLTPHRSGRDRGLREHGGDLGGIDALGHRLERGDRGAYERRLRLVPPLDRPAEERARLLRHLREDRREVDGDLPEQAAELIMPMCTPEWTETGRLYDYKTRTLMSFRAPA
jgi:hypothetical protein